MPIKKFISWLFAGATALCLTSSAKAQDFQPFGPTGIECDAQLFAPLELDQLGGPMPANEGYYFTYDRMFLGVNRRREDTSAEFIGDQGWGNRYEFGYMTDDSVYLDGGGWLCSVLRIDGPENIPGLPVDDINLDGIVNIEDVDLLPRNNVTAGGVEVMKTWRTERLHYGSIIEPMIGVRWFYFKDRGLNIFDQTGFTGVVLNDYASDNTFNDIVGPQVGFRWYRQRERWLVSAEGRFMAGANMREAYFGHLHDVAWAPLAEIRLEATYEIFRNFSVRAGYTGIFVPQGIARSTLDYIYDPTATLTNEDAAIHALTFGFAFNR